MCSSDSDMERKRKAASRGWAKKQLLRLWIKELREKKITRENYIFDGKV